METLEISTDKNKQMVNLDHKIKAILQDQNWQNGVLTVFVPHTTAGVTINENADPDVEKDILSFCQNLVPRNWGFDHAEGNSDAHILSSFFSSSLQVIVENGIMMLGTWQSIFFCEFDGPRKRKILLEFTEK